jgi:sialic acid synthase SpsE
MEPSEFTALVKEGSAAKLALGNKIWSMQDTEKESRRLRRSLFIAIDVAEGDFINGSNVRALRPGNGLDAKFYDRVQGLKFKSSYAKGTPLSLDFLEGWE